MDIPLITIEVTPDIAKKIRDCAEAGVFGIRTGNATINFHEGIIKSIKTEFYSYPHKEQVVPLDIPVKVAILK